MALDRKQLEHWLRQALLVQHEGWGACVRFELHHARALSGTAAGAAVEVLEVTEQLCQRLEDGAATSAAINELVTAVETAVRAHLAGLGGRQRYVVHAYFAKSATPRLEFPFAELGAGDDAGAMIAETDGTMSGFFANVAQYTAKLQAQNLQATSLLRQSLEAENERLTRLNARLMDDREKFLELQEDLLSRRHERDLAAKRADAAIETKRSVAKTLTQLLPLGLHAALGVRVPQLRAAQEPNEEPASATTIEMMVKAFVEGVTEEQLAAIAPLVGPETLQLFWDLAQATQQGAEESASVWREKYAAANPHPRGDTPTEWMVSVLEDALDRDQRAAISASLTSAQAMLFNFIVKAIREKPRRGK